MVYKKFTKEKFRLDPTQQLQPYVTWAESFVKNSQYVLKILAKVKLSPKNKLVTFDIISLFTRVLMEVITDILKTKLLLKPVQFIHQCVSIYHLFLL